jgi:hypothetical protein
MESSQRLGPRGGAWLLDELHALRRIGVEVLVCALTDAEQIQLGRALLVRDGLSSEQAWELLATARGLPVPDTDQQRQWLQRFANQ